MITLFCGSRTWNDPDPIRKVMESILSREPTIIHGDQFGADLISDSVARSLNLPVISIPAEWETYGDKAGPIRNEKMRQMVVQSSKIWNIPVACFAFHEDPMLGSGTRDMVRRCRLSRIRCSVFLNVSHQIKRCSHLSICDICNSEYGKHPDIISELDSNGIPFLRLLCNGEYIKL